MSADPVYDPGRPRSLYRQFLLQDGALFHRSNFKFMGYHGTQPKPEQPFAEGRYSEDRVEELMRMHHSTLASMVEARGLEPATGEGSKAENAKILAEAELSDEE